MIAFEQKITYVDHYVFPARYTTHTSGCSKIVSNGAPLKLFSMDLAERVEAGYACSSEGDEGFVC